MFSDLSLLLGNDDKGLLCGFQSGFKMWFVIQSSKETINSLPEQIIASEFLKCLKAIQIQAFN